MYVILNFHLKPSQPIWNHSTYPNPNNYQQTQVPPPALHPNTYWSSGQTYPAQAQVYDLSTVLTH